jgi:hypothetical protein
MDRPPEASLPFAGVNWQDSAAWRSVTVTFHEAGDALEWHVQARGPFIYFYGRGPRNFFLFVGNYTGLFGDSRTVVLAFRGDFPATLSPSYRSVTLDFRTMPDRRGFVTHWLSQAKAMDDCRQSRSIPSCLFQATIHRDRRPLKIQRWGSAMNVW